MSTIDELDDILAELRKENNGLRNELENYRSIAEKEGATIAISEKEQLQKQLIDLKLFIINEINLYKPLESNAREGTKISYYNGYLNGLNSALQKL